MGGGIEGGEWEYYDESDEDDFYGHTANLIGDFEMSDRLSFSLSDNFVKTRDSADLDDLGNIRTREKYYQNRLSCTVVDSRGN